MMKKRKTETMAARRQRARGGISLSNEEEKNYKSDTENETNPDQAGNNKNPLQFREGGIGKSYKQ